ncbi:MAG TPA: hypothetical protein QGF63_12590 [Alphaproteobacteria bacterium]|jgi:hypothetical protein|nr:hypothetical protein [Alphaproteobacteria bacterium]HJM50671.1 hypothetical protein [Alphaproteobacteria bacterium]
MAQRILLNDGTIAEPYKGDFKEFDGRTRISCRVTSPEALGEKTLEAIRMTWLDERGD